MESKLAPIAFFVYNRVEHVARALQSLKENAESIHSDLYVFSDGPLSPLDQEPVETIRRNLKNLSGFKSIQIIEQDKNIGHERSLLLGIDHILSRHESIIVLEDDLLCSPFFLQYLNEGLKKYEKNQKIASIVAYCFPIGKDLPETYFMRGSDSWGWATWKHAWSGFERDSKKILSSLEDKGMQWGFDLEESVPHMQRLRELVEGKNKSWSIHWKAHCYLKGLLSLYPGRSLVQNMGFDGTGTLSPETHMFEVSLSKIPIQIKDISIQENPKAIKKMVQFYRKNKSNLFSFIVDFLKRKIRRARF